MIRLSKYPKEIRKEQLLSAVQNEEHVYFFDTNGYTNNPYQSIDWMLGIGSHASLQSDLGATDSFAKLRDFYEQHKDWCLGYLSYELKDQLENLNSDNTDQLDFPLLKFIIPNILFISRKNQIEVYGYSPEDAALIDQLLAKAKSLVLSSYQVPDNLHIQNRISKTDYIQAVQKLLGHIQYGDIFEINFCQEFFAENVDLDPITTYLKLNELSPTPFSSFIKDGERFLLSASPERYLKKEGYKLISQPIKGTIKRGLNETEDEVLKQQLQQDPKERGENLMIVDLVRNDLSVTAKKASVNVEELCGIYTYPQVHQMISTVVSELDSEFHFIDAIKHSFPMGSMTGAPKVKAMELIETYEQSRRGLFSGSVGYITPGGDFDFSVIIRSMLYNQQNSYLSFTTGGAITRLSIPENEYDECMLKAEAMIRTLKK